MVFVLKTKEIPQCYKIADYFGGPTLRFDFQNLNQRTGDIKQSGFISRL